MSYLTDKEKRLLFSALSREKEVCKQVDKECCREPHEDTLESVVKSLERKFRYDRFEKEIRAKVIDEFAERLHGLEFDNEYGVNVVLTPKQIDEITEEMRGAK